MKSFLVLIILLNVNGQPGKKNLSNNSSDLFNDSTKICAYIDKTVGDFLNEFKKNITDSFPTRQYTGDITSFFVKSGNRSYEIYPDLKSRCFPDTKTSPPFSLKMFEHCKIKKIVYRKKGKVVKSCGTI
jgi:hypothetical protein